MVMKYEMKDLRKVKTIIGQQIYRNLITKTIRISLSVYIRDLVTKNIINYNILIIPMIAESTSKINTPDDYKKTNLRKYE